MRKQNPARGVKLMLISNYVIMKRVSEIYLSVITNSPGADSEIRLRWEFVANFKWRGGVAFS